MFVILHTTPLHYIHWYATQVHNFKSSWPWSVLPPEHLSLRVPFSTVQVLVYTYFCNDSSYSSWLSTQSVYIIMWLYIFINLDIHCGIPAFFSLSQLWGRLKASYSIVKDGKGSLRRCFLRLFCSSSFSPSLVTLSPCPLGHLIFPCVTF